MSNFRKATKHAAKLRLALCGPSGSGKTFSALRLAKGLGGKIAVIDTERGSASLYADAFNFDVLELAPPYQPSKYVAAIEDATNAGYDILIIDSLSHAWAGEGGILETVDDVQSRGGNKFTAWGPAGKAQNNMVNTILGCPLHVIVTMRSKQEYAIEVAPNGKQQIRKLGMAPVQRDGVEYEFAVVLDVNMNHEVSVGMAGKDRTGLFADKPPHLLSEADGKAIAAWMSQLPPQDGTDGKPDAGTGDVKAAIVAGRAALVQTNSEDDLRKLWITFPPAVREALEQDKDARKLYHRRDVIDGLANLLDIDLAGLHKLASGNRIDLDSMSADDAERLISLLQEEQDSRCPA